MIGSTLLAMIMGFSPQNKPELDAIQNRTFNIVGFFCDDKICETVPRPITDTLRFDEDANKQLLAHATQLPDDWAFTFNCGIKRDRLRSCYLTGQHNRATTGLAIALKLVGQVRLAHTNHQYPRAIVDVAYEVGGCPSWFCVPTPPPKPDV